MLLEGKVFIFITDMKKILMKKKIDLIWLRQGVSLKKYLKYSDIKRIS